MGGCGVRVVACLMRGRGRRKEEGGRRERSRNGREGERIGREEREKQMLRSCGE